MRHITRVISIAELTIYDAKYSNSEYIIHSRHYFWVCRFSSCSSFVFYTVHTSHWPFISDSIHKSYRQKLNRFFPWSHSVILYFRWKLIYNLLIKPINCLTGLLKCVQLNDNQREMQKEIKDGNKQNMNLKLISPFTSCLYYWICDLVFCKSLHCKHSL